MMINDFVVLTRSFVGREMDCEQFSVALCVGYIRTRLLCLIERVGNLLND